MSEKDALWSPLDSNKDHREDELGEKCIYYAAVLGASMWASWITWMPFVHVSYAHFVRFYSFLCGFHDSRAGINTMCRYTYTHMQTKFPSVK